MARQPKVVSKPRLHETRSLSELAEQFGNSACQLALVEVRSENLNELLQLLSRSTPVQFRFVALLENPPEQPRPGGTLSKASSISLVDLLWEIGAVEVLYSPRQIECLITLHSRLLASLGTDASGAAPPTLADWAWFAIPWQDA